jgi:serine/threonine-protein kinase
MSELQAEQILQTAGFNVHLLSETPVGQSVPAGEVWSQTVPGGAKAPRGTTITLDVAPLSRATVTVPSVIGMTQVQATQVLQVAGFNVIVQPQTPPAAQSVPAGVVWSQTVPGGAKAPRGTTITIYVAPN